MTPVVHSTPSESSTVPIVRQQLFLAGSMVVAVQCGNERRDCHVRDKAFEQFRRDPPDPAGCDRPVLVDP